MSDYQTVVGTVQCLRRFNNEEKLEEFCINHLKYVLNIEYDKTEGSTAFDVLKEYYDDNYQYLFIANNAVWLISDSKRLYDDDGSYCHLVETYPGEYNFRTRFYDGGTYEAEMVKDEIEKLKL